MEGWVKGDCLRDLDVMDPEWVVIMFCVFFTTEDSSQLMVTMIIADVKGPSNHCIHSGCQLCADGPVQHSQCLLS